MKIELLSHIVLIGFQSVGKSSISRSLSSLLGLDLINLDSLIQLSYSKKNHKYLRCRTIMREYGSIYYRILEVKILSKILTHRVSVIDLGGGSISSKKYRRYIESHIVINVMIKKSLAYLRILKNGYPILFKNKKDKSLSLQKIWINRNSICKKVSNFDCANNNSIWLTSFNIINRLSADVKYKFSLLLIHGPNLNLLAVRNFNIYGNASLLEIEIYLSCMARKHHCFVHNYHSNHEGSLIDYLQSCSSDYDGIIINSGALTHYSYSLYDAILDLNLPVVEVHISNIIRREKWRQKSIILDSCVGHVQGIGFLGYEKSLKILIEYINQNI